MVLNVFENKLPFKLQTSTIGSLGSGEEGRVLFYRLGSELIF